MRTENFDLPLLIRQHNSLALTLISPLLFELTDDRSMVYFHDEERYSLFFIHLNEYLNTEFPSPISQRKVSLFQLIIDTLSEYRGVSDVDSFLRQAEITKEFFTKKRYYTYYISPHVINFDISFARLINFQANYSKHSFYHLSRMKEKLKKIFKQNDIIGYEDEDYNDHLITLKEAVLDDRLNFNQTKMIQILGDFFLSYWKVIYSNEGIRIRNAIHDFVEEKGRGVPWTFEPPVQMSDIETFYWKIKAISFCKKSRLEEYLPNTSPFLTEPNTSPENRINKSGTH